MAPAYIYVACSGSAHPMGTYHPSIVVSPVSLESQDAAVLIFQIVPSSSGTWVLAHQGPVPLHTDLHLVGLVALGEAVVAPEFFMEYFSKAPAIPAGVQGKHLVLPSFAHIIRGI